jgi:hypothetical protein
MENLSCLYCKQTDKSLLRLFPHITLVCLTIHNCLEVFLQKIQDFQGLKWLWLFEDRAYLPILPLPSLEHLTVRNCRSVNLRGLTKLKSLDVDKISAPDIFGKEEIYPLLTSLSGSHDSFLGDDIRKYPNLKSFRYNSITNVSSLEQLKQYESIPNLKLGVKPSFFTLLNGIFQFSVQSTAKSLELGHYRILVIAKQPSISQLKLICCSVNDLSCFSSVQFLSLNNCCRVTDLTPVRDVPYISIEACEDITEFSCLGKKQRYLCIAHCDELQDLDIEGFDSVGYLSIKSCHSVRRIVGLQQTRIFNIVNCRELVQVSLLGNDYMKVDCCSCRSLGELSIAGKVYSLRIRNCRKLKQENVTNFEYLDFEEY